MATRMSTPRKTRLGLGNVHILGSFISYADANEVYFCSNYTVIFNVDLQSSGDMIVLDRGHLGSK